MTISPPGNVVGLSMSGFFTGSAIEVTNANPRGFITRINGNADAGYLAVSNAANFQGIAFQYNYFRAGNAINITNPVAGSEVNGFYFNPTVSGQGASAIFGFRSSLASAANRWNLYFDGTASNYIQGSLGIGLANPVGKTDIVTGFADASSLNQAETFRLRSTTVDGNTRVMNFGISHTGAGGANQLAR